MIESKELEIEGIATEAGLVALAEEWTALLSRCPSATPFQTPEWLIPWWRCLGQGTLFALALRRSGKLAGLFPYCIEGSPPRLVLMGTGVTDYLDILLDPDCEREGMNAMFDFLLRDGAAWTGGDFSELRVDSPLLKATFPARLEAYVAPCSTCPVAALPPTVEAFSAGLSSGQRRHVERTKKKILEANAISLLRADEHSLEEFLGELFRLHQSRWKERNLPGVLSEGRIREFHRQAAAGLLRRGLLNLYCLKFNDTTVAAIYAIRGKERMYSYIGGFDPAFEHLSPGMVALDFVIEDSIRKGVREFDFLRGAEPYKYLWGARDRSNYRISFRRRARQFTEAAS